MSDTLKNLKAAKRNPENILLKYSVLSSPLIILFIISGQTMNFVSNYLDTSNLSHKMISFAGKGVIETLTISAIFIGDFYSKCQSKTNKLEPLRVVKMVSIVMFPIWVSLTIIGYARDIIPIRKTKGEPLVAGILLFFTYNWLMNYSFYYRSNLCHRAGKTIKSPEDPLTSLEKRRRDQNDSRYKLNVMRADDTKAKSTPIAQYLSPAYGRHIELEKKKGDIIETDIVETDIKRPDKEKRKPDYARVWVPIYVGSVLAIASFILIVGHAKKRHDENDPLVRAQREFDNAESDGSSNQDSDQ